MRNVVWASVIAVLAACADQAEDASATSVEEALFDPETEWSIRLGSARAQMKRSGTTSVDLMDPTTTLDALDESSQSYFVAPVLATSKGDPEYLGLLDYDADRDGRSGPMDADVRDCMEGLGYAFADGCPDEGCPEGNHWAAFNDLLDENEERCDAGGNCPAISIWVPNNDAEGTRWDEQTFAGANTALRTPIASDLSAANVSGDAVNWIATAHEMSCLAATHPHFTGMIVDDFYWLDSGEMTVRVGDEDLEVRGLCGPERFFLAEGVDQTSVPDHFLRFRGGSSNQLCYGRSIAQAILAATNVATSHAEFIPWIYPRQIGDLIADSVTLGSAWTGGFSADAAASATYAVTLPRFRASDYVYVRLVFAAEVEARANPEELAFEITVNESVVYSTVLLDGEENDRTRVVFAPVPRSALRSRGANELRLTLRAPPGYSGAGRALLDAWGVELILTNRLYRSLPQPEELIGTYCTDRVGCAVSDPVLETSGEGTDMMAIRGAAWEESYSHCFDEDLDAPCFDGVMSFLNQIRTSDEMLTTTEYAHVLSTLVEAMGAVPLITGHKGRPDTNEDWDVEWSPDRLSDFMAVAHRYTEHHVVYEFPMAVHGWSESTSSASLGVFSQRDADDASVRAEWPSQQIEYSGFEQTFERDLRVATFAASASSLISGITLDGEPSEGAAIGFEATVYVVVDGATIDLFDAFTLEPLSSSCATLVPTFVSGSQVTGMIQCTMDGSLEGVRIGMNVRTVAPVYPANYRTRLWFYDGECEEDACVSPWSDEWDFTVDADSRHRATYEDLSDGFACLRAGDSSCFDTM